MEGYDAFAAPVTQVPPFAVEHEYPVEIDGVPMGSYLEWFRSCSRITVTAHPAILALVVLLGVRLRLAHHPIDLVLAEAARRGDA